MAKRINALGQEEVAPSKWALRKEARRQMYVNSTEKGVEVRKKSAEGGGKQRCQRCLQVGHWTYQCSNEQAYASRPSRSSWLKNPKLKPDLDGEAPPESEMEEALKKELKKLKKKYGQFSPNASSSSSESSSSDSDSSDEEGSSSSDSENNSNSSDSSENESSSSDSSSKPKKKQSKKKSLKAKETVKLKWI